MAAGNEFYLRGGVGLSGPPSVRQQLDFNYSLTPQAGSIQMPLERASEDAFFFPPSADQQRGWGGPA